MVTKNREVSGKSIDLGVFSAKELKKTLSMISNAVTSALGKSARNKGLVDKDLKRKKRKYKLPLFKLVIPTGFEPILPP